MKFEIILIFPLFFNLFLANEIKEDRRVVRVNLEVPSDFDSWLIKSNSTNATNSNQEKKSFSGKRISNGYRATERQFPWVAELWMSTPYGLIYCTSSLISNRFVMSARHCIADRGATSVLVFMGSAYRSSSSRVRIFSDMYYWMNSQTGSNHPEIALFRLSQIVRPTAFINTVRLPSRYQARWTYEGYTMTAAGWGTLSGGTFATFLQWTRFRVLPLSQCNFGQYTLCSQPIPVESSSLEAGDSGSPSVIYDAFGIPTIIGINLFYFEHGGIRWMGSARVDQYLQFIGDITGIPIR